MQSFVGNFCNNVLEIHAEFQLCCKKMFCNNIGRQATTTSIQIHKQKIDDTPKSHVNRQRSTLHQLRRIGSYCIELSQSFQVLPIIKQSLSKATQDSAQLQQVESGLQFLTTWTSDKDGKLTLMDFQGWQGNSSSIEVFSCGYIFRGVRGKQS